MRKVIIIVAAAIFAVGCFAKGLLPSQVHRRGLDNWQIDDILAKHPTAVLHISAADWRGMRYQLHRFNNMTNYVEQTAYKLVNKGWRPRVKPGRHYDGEFVPFNEHFDKWVIITTNTIERVTTVPAHSVYRDTLTNLTAEVSTLTATNAVLAPEAAKAWKIEHAREKAKKKDKKNLDKLIADITKARDKSSEAMEGLYDSVLEVLTNKVEAVTEGE